MTDYPILSQRSLPKVERRGLRGILPPRRNASDLPLPNAHEAVVYKHGGRYIVDDGYGRTTDDHIVNATNITVVDMREDAPVQAETFISSAGEVEFVVHVTFLCTVKKPEEVAAAGLHDIKSSLTSYLNGDQALFHLGDDYHLNEITIVRKNVAAEVKAFFSVRPPKFRGVDVKLGSVQVFTPDELHNQQRESEMKTLLTSEQQRREHELERERAELEEERRRNAEAFELQRHHHEQMQQHMQQQMARMQEQFQQQMEQQRQDHERLLREKNFAHAADETAKLKEALGADASDMATIFAGAAGAQSIAATTEALNADRDRRLAQEAEDNLRRETWNREEKRYERELERENTKMQYDMEATRLKAQAEVVVSGISRGLADHRDIEHVTSAFNGMAKGLQSASSNSSKPEAVDGQAEDNEPGDDEGVVDAQVVPDDLGPDDDDIDGGLREEDLGR